MGKTTRLFRRLFKRPQFSLLALLILIAACAALIQFAILPAYRRSAKKKILAQITELKGQWVDISEQPLRRRLLLQGERVDDAFMHDLADVVHLVPELTQLDLLQTSVTDDGWRDLLDHRSKLDHFVLFENAITEKAIAQAIKDYPTLIIEIRRPDPIALKLAKAPIPPAAIISMEYQRHDGRLLFGSGDGRLHRINLLSDAGRYSDKKHADWVFDLAISPSGEWVATAGGDNTLLIHRATDLTTVASGKGHLEDVHGVVWMDDSQLVTVGDDASLRLWRMQTSNQPSAPDLTMVASLTAHDKQIPRLVKLDHQSVLTVSRDHTLRRWRVDKSGFELLQTYVGHRDDCMDASADPDAMEFVSVGYDGKLILWDVANGKRLLERQLGQERLFSVNVDWQTRLAFVGSKTCLRSIDLDSGRLLRVNADQTYISRIICSGNTLLTSDGFGRIFQRNPATLSTISRFQLFEGSLDIFSSQGFVRVGLYLPNHLLN